jgi:hypothetical protein
MMERAGKKNGNNKDWQFWQRHNKPIEIKDLEMFAKNFRLHTPKSGSNRICDKTRGLEI